MAGLLLPLLSPSCEQHKRPSELHTDRHLTFSFIRPTPFHTAVWLVCNQRSPETWERFTYAPWWGLRSMAFLRLLPCAVSLGGCYDCSYRLLLRFPSSRSSPTREMLMNLTLNIERLALRLRHICWYGKVGRCRFLYTPRLTSSAERSTASIDLASAAAVSASAYIANATLQQVPTLCIHPIALERMTGTEAQAASHSMW